MEWIKNNIIHIVVYVIFLSIIIWLLSYRPFDEYESKYNDAIKKVESNRAEQEKLTQKIEELQIEISVEQFKRDSIMNKINESNALLNLYKKKYNEKIANINTFTNHELQRYFSINYPDSVSR